LTLDEWRLCSVTSWGFSLPHTWQLSLLTVPHTHELCFIREIHSIDVQRLAHANGRWR
jgi:hypothetical protein